MYDIHCHILPAFDDGAADLKTALTMAHIAIDDGITHICCTPHIYPEIYENDTSNITQAVIQFRQQLKKNKLDLTLSVGADIQHVTEMVTRLNDTSMPTINGSSYVLFEPPHHVAPPYFEKSVIDVQYAGYTPIITHPERLSWIDTHYDKFLTVANQGGWIQLTAGSLTGRFGKRAQYWAEKMLDDGIVHVLATDAHNTKSRAPLLSEGYQAALKYVDQTEAKALVYDRPKAVWENQAIDDIPLPPGYAPSGHLLPPKTQQPSFWKRLFKPT